MKYVVLKEWRITTFHALAINKWFFTHLCFWIQGCVVQKCSFKEIIRLRQREVDLHFRGLPSASSLDWCNEVEVFFVWVQWYFTHPHKQGHSGLTTLKKNLISTVDFILFSCLSMNTNTGLGATKGYGSYVLFTYILKVEATSHDIRISIYSQR